MAEIDPRITAARADLAATHLHGIIAAERYVEGVEREILAPATPLRPEPRPDASLMSELLFGERFTVYDEREGWAWGQAAQDAYVGYVAAQALGSPGPAPTHTVAALRTYLHPAADLKAPPLALVSMNAKLNVRETRDKFSACRFEGTTAYVFTDHLAPIAARAKDYVSVAEAFVGTPYLWGGKQSLGLDCSALVQIALERIGVRAPRDTDQQERELGDALALDPSALKRGDLVFWQGHIGIMVDRTNVLHANATVMAVTVDPLRRFAEAVAHSVGPITSMKRL